jgi:hypothetical protein
VLQLFLQTQTAASPSTVSDAPSTSSAPHIQAACVLERLPVSKQRTAVWQLPYMLGTWPNAVLALQVVARQPLQETLETKTQLRLRELSLGKLKEYDQAQVSAVSSRGSASCILEAEQALDLK